MSRFDDWVTDPAVTLAGVHAFLADRTHIGEAYLGRYLVWKSSGTTGIPGIYVQDQAAIATYGVLVAAQLGSPYLGARMIEGSMSQGGRSALVLATENHFAGVALWENARRGNTWLAARSFSIMLPLDELVAALNAYQPAFLASYPTMLDLLADEAAAGRLRIAPSILWSGGEVLGASARAAIECAFHCPLVNEYGASECMTIGFGCTEGWLHVHADWVVLEPVDERHQPVPAGEASATVLLTNLANRLQPIIRYDLGDSVRVQALPCACGNPLPALRIEGRRDDVLSLQGRDGRFVKLVPLALTTVVEEACAVRRFQLVQTAPDRLSLRLDAETPELRQSAWRLASRALRSYLDSQSLDNVLVALDPAPPLVNARTGKLREVVVEPGANVR